MAGNGIDKHRELDEEALLHMRRVILEDPFMRELIDDTMRNFRPILDANEAADLLAFLEGIVEVCVGNVFEEHHHKPTAPPNLLETNWKSAYASYAMEISSGSTILDPVNQGNPSLAYSLYWIILYASSAALMRIHKLDPHLIKASNEESTRAVEEMSSAMEQQGERVVTLTAHSSVDTQWALLMWLLAIDDDR